MKFSEININDIKDIAIKAGIAIMDIYKKDFDIEYKKDKSPITQADKISNEIICSSLDSLPISNLHTDGPIPNLRILSA